MKLLKLQKRGKRKKRFKAIELPKLWGEKKKIMAIELPKIQGRRKKGMWFAEARGKKKKKNYNN